MWGNAMGDTMTAAAEQLGQEAADIAIRGALRYLQRHGRLDLATANKLEEPLRRCVKAAIPVALADAKAALDCGMVAVARATFAATMLQAGIAAGKEVYFVAD